MADQGEDLKGKGKIVEEGEGCDGAGTSDTKMEKVVHGDYEQAHLPVWKDSHLRRGTEYQFIKDVPCTLPCLRAWLKLVRDFQELFKLEVPEYDGVEVLAYEGWPGNWKMKALLQFQAVANATGIIHRPRRKVDPPSETKVVKLRSAAVELLPVLALPASGVKAYPCSDPSCEVSAPPVPTSAPPEVFLRRSPPPIINVSSETSAKTSSLKSCPLMADSDASVWGPAEDEDTSMPDVEK